MSDVLIVWLADVVQTSIVFTTAFFTNKAVANSPEKLTRVWSVGPSSSSNSCYHNILGTPGPVLTIPHVKHPCFASQILTNGALTLLAVGRIGLPEKTYFDDKERTVITGAHFIRQPLVEHTVQWKD